MITILAAITIIELIANHNMESSTLLWLLYGIYRVLVYLIKQISQ